MVTMVNELTSTNANTSMKPYRPMTNSRMVGNITMAAHTLSSLEGSGLPMAASFVSSASISRESSCRVTSSVVLGSWVSFTFKLTARSRCSLNARPFSVMGTVIASDWPRPPMMPPKRTMVATNIRNQLMTIQFAPTRFPATGTEIRGPGTLLRADREDWL